MSIARLIPGLGSLAVTEVPNGQDNGDLKWALDAVKAKLGRIRLRDAYYNGDHRLAYVTKDWRNEFGKMLKAFNANYCPRVVDTLADRLRLAGVDATRGDTPWQEGNDALGVVWQRNRMDRRAGSIHTGALTHGELYVTVWPHPVTEEITYYPARGDRMAIRYQTDNPDDLALAAKVWMENKQARITLYYPTHVERWATKDASLYNGLPAGPGAFEPYGEDWL
ncbi:MAG TPA: phage portal protein, partial [Gemmatimonadales bacterium]|nr:phage portal protein [Gemmatimonadales bacterium]